MIMSRLRDFLSLVKFEHTIFALPFALVSAILAQRWLTADIAGDSLSGEWINLPLFAPSPDLARLLQNILSSSPGEAGIFPSFYDLVFILTAMISGRTVAMLANRLIDAEIDAKNPRTMAWHLPAGIIKPRQLISWIVVSSAVFFLSAFLLNLKCFLLAPFALAYLILYPYSKRFTSACHYVLGGAQAIAPIGVFLAITGTISPVILPMALGVGLWVASFDIYYSFQDYDFDLKEGIHSIAVSLGKESAKTIALFGHILAGFLFLVTGLLFGMNKLFLLGTIALTIVLIIENLIVRFWEELVGFAFFTVNGFISIAFFVVTVIAVLLNPRHPLT